MKYQKSICWFTRVVPQSILLLVIIYLIMIKLRKIVSFTFARNRTRRQIQFDPKVKDFTSQEDIRLQTQQLRQKFQRIPSQKFSSILNNPNPKLEKRFFIDKKSLNKKVKEIYKQKIDIKNLQTHDDTDLDYLSASKSHLYDQAKQIQFEEQFKQQLFRVKETKRLLGKKQKQINNYLPGKEKDEKYFQYEDKKKQLKNKKINNMMNMNRNNQQLSLLIESGLFNDPANIQAVISEISGQKQQLIQQKPKEPVDLKGTTEIVEGGVKEKDLSEKLQDIGPEHLKQRHKIVEFVQKFEQQHQNDQKSCLEDLNLLKQIKEYEQEVFLSRYDNINFRFKGRVNFGFFKQNELVSYIKNEKIEPKDLLLIFKQNQKTISKFQAPIMTPRVIGNLYSKTSLYKFPETDQNNRLNMINDPLFQALQRKTFKEVAKLNDTDFCSVLWAYANNHQDEQGALRIKLYEKINQVILEQLSFRVFNLNEEDLGLAMRGMTKLHLTKEGIKWDQIVTCLEKRIPEIKNAYALESIYQFLLCLPQSHHIYEIAEKNITKFDEFKWQQVNTVLTFTNASGLILKQARGQNNLIVKEKLKQIIINQKYNLNEVLPRVSINNMSQFLTVLRQSGASLVLPKTVNLCQKLVIDNIKTQKEMIKSYNLGNILGSFALIDLQKYQNKNKSKFDQESQPQSMSISVRKLSLRTLLPFQPVPYNSSSFRIYHELASLAHEQMSNIPNIFLAKILDQLSLVKYKNERLHDEIVQKILQTLQSAKQNRFQFSTHQSQITTTKLLSIIVNSYTLQKRNNNLLLEALQEVLSQKHFGTLCKQSPNFLIRFVSGVLSVNAEEGNSHTIQKLERILAKIIVPLIRSNVYIEEELAAISYCMVMLNRYDLMTNLDLVSIQDIKNPIAAFTLRYCFYLAKLSREGIEAFDQEYMKELAGAEQAFYHKVFEQVLYNQSCIGSPLSYKTVYSKILDMVRQTHKGKEVKKNNWLIEIPIKKQAYFVGTYDHLMARQASGGQQNTQSSRFTTYGIWKLLMKNYQLRGWKVKIIISFLQGK